ncbi:MAG: acyl carrier protein [Planctomycetaceae bacterium]|nr:acyl carrier protein [Planctomycetaceae bacterium]
MASTEEKVIGIIADQLGRERDEITLTTDIQKDLGADSLDIAEMLIQFEDEFNITIEESEAQNIVTVADVVSHIAAAVNGQAGGAADTEKEEK